MLLNPNPCCAKPCECCKNGVANINFAFTIAGVANLPVPVGQEPPEGEMQEYFRYSNAEDLNGEYVFTSDDFGECEQLSPAFAPAECRILNEQEDLFTVPLHGERYYKAYEEPPDPEVWWWEKDQEYTDEIEVQVWFNTYSDGKTFWDLRFQLVFSNSRTWRIFHDNLDGPFDCDTLQDEELDLLPPPDPPLTIPQMNVENMVVTVTTSRDE